MDQWKNSRMNFMQRINFKHDLLPEVKLTDEIIDGKRYYTLPDGSKLRSVTTVIKENTDQSGIIAWRKRKGDEEANRISAKATRHGTAVHKVAERYLLNEEDYIGRTAPTSVLAFKPIMKVLNEHVDNIRGIELPLYSKALKTAGRTDVIANYDGVLSVIDFKTSLRPKREEWIQNYFIQSTCYSMMAERMYKIEVPQIAIIISVEDEHECQLFVKDRSQYVNRVMEIFTSK